MRLLRILLITSGIAAIILTGVMNLGKKTHNTTIYSQFSQ